MRLYVQFVVKSILLFFSHFWSRSMKKEQNKFYNKLNIKDARCPIEISYLDQIIRLHSWQLSCQLMRDEDGQLGLSQFKLIIAHLLIVKNRASEHGNEDLFLIISRLWSFGLLNGFSGQGHENHCRNRCYVTVTDVMMLTIWSIWKQLISLSHCTIEPTDMRMLWPYDNVTSARNRKPAGVHTIVT